MFCRNRSIARGFSMTMFETGSSAARFAFMVSLSLLSPGMMEATSPSSICLCEI